MEADSIKLLGAGLAAIGAGLAALGVGNVFAAFLEGALRNPGAAAGQQGNMFIGFAAAELLGLLAFVVAVLLIFVA
ncbi:ATP synthase F0 subcomplex C subunit [Sphingomonas guangdongensis]|jgi:F-type H+-transporting ATPase subunit c|uniref:ATP synthase subunit c n=1 Tax=Sphingomonas guangdongensis TaxID=1141890 RepID=A0A285QY83_9SPHN|nr:F0F1 ATP synthase subunit C [Sphingomonas guangdongensis]SOB86786.1 ATP synthase F0 subcomplex C subunit [Sphingomonas guangdongensis]